MSDVVIPEARDIPLKTENAAFLTFSNATLQVPRDFFRQLQHWNLISDKSWEINDDHEKFDEIL